MKKRAVFIVLIFSLFCMDAYAGERIYKIELVIFAQNMPNTEIFDQTESRIKWPKTIVNRGAYENVDPKYMGLHGSYAKLARNQNYQPLMHVAWIQHVKAHRLSTAVKISNTAGTINGFFRMQRGNLVHMIVDIEYSPASIIYRLAEKRRFKLNDTHYLDHPKFGILARISPLN